MSHQLIAHSEDLLRLRNEGYDIEIVNGYLVVNNVPYVDSTANIKRGKLICQLTLSGNQTNKPKTHVAYWIGEHPCHANGNKISAIEHSHVNKNLGNGIKVDFQFSAKPKDGYRDYYHQVTTYIGRITGEATQIDPDATAQTFPIILEEDGESVFKYVDTASSRADINEVSEKLSGLTIGIVGLGGTGSYILDLVAKTWVKEIHLFDRDIFSQHNAFRSPGAPSVEELRQRSPKVDHFVRQYSNMRYGVVPHDELCESNLNMLEGLDFVFICVDQGEAKKLIVSWLEDKEIPFIEVGMGILLNDGQLSGNIRTVISTPENRESASQHISYDDGNINNEYATNIQIAELNALNASIAVIYWKAYYGIYCYTGTPYYAGYSIVSGEIAVEYD